MDDQKFDDIIKSKVGDYEEKGFDPGSLASLHHQMAMQSAVPWYVSRRSELITGCVVAVSTLMILMVQGYWHQEQTQMLTDEITILRSNRYEFENLQQELDSLKNITRDTIRVIEIRQVPSSDYIVLQKRIRALEYEIQRLADDQHVSLQNDAYPGLAEGYNEDPGNTGHETDSGYSRPARLTPRSHDETSVRAIPGDLGISTTAAGGNLSAKMIREMEKHYQNGIGIKVGPALEASAGRYSVGSGQFTFGYGLVGDLILSPSISLETGVKYFKRIYDVNDINDLNKMSWPGANESLGELQKAEVDNMTLEIPLNFKYRYPVSLKTHWLASMGYSQTLYLNQLFEYEYAFDDGSGDNSYVIHSRHKENKVTLYPGTLNFSIGLSNQLKNNKTLETSLFYQHGLGDVGVEKMRVKFFGVRGIYWIDVK